MNTTHVYVRLTDGTVEWRTVQAESLNHAFEVAAAMPDVDDVFEASCVPGGVVT